MSEGKLTEKDQDRLYFMMFVRSYDQMAWAALGKIANPMTGKVERDLDQAKFAIDMLGMLERRTKGNLDPDEARTFGQILLNLRLNYVEELKRPPEPEPEPEKPSESAPGPETVAPDQQKSDAGEPAASSETPKPE